MGELREIDAAEITRVVRDLCIEINYRVPEEMVALVTRARELEESPLGRQVLDLLNELLPETLRFPTDRWAVENGGG